MRCVAPEFCLMSVDIPIFIFVENGMSPVWQNSHWDQSAAYLFFVLLKTSEKDGMQRMLQCSVMICCSIIPKDLSISFQHGNGFRKDAHIFSFNQQTIPRNLFLVLLVFVFSCTRLEAHHSLLLKERRNT